MKFLLIGIVTALPEIQIPALVYLSFVDQSEIGSYALFIDNQKFIVPTYILADLANKEKENFSKKHNSFEFLKFASKFE